MPLPELVISLTRLPHGDGLPLPSYASAGAAGLDVVAAEDLTLAPGARHAVATAAHLVGSEPRAAGEGDERARLLLESLPPERYPRLVEASAPLTRGTDPDAYVTMGLELLLAGITTVARGAEG